MFSVTVRSHMMIAHSLPDPFFGPAAALHGATYVVDLEFKSAHLNPQNVVIDIGVAARLADEVLAQLNYRNLDELEMFKGVLTTTEYLAAYIHGQLAQRLGDAFSGSLKVTLNESHIASASYEAAVA